MTHVIATRRDLDALAVTNPEEHARFVALLQASLVTCVDTQVYPEGYDRMLAPSSAGYLAPIQEDRSTPESAARFGFTPEELTA